MPARTRPSPAVRAAAVVTAALSLLLTPVLAAGPAAAGGPTSVLLTAPAIGRTASLYTTDAAYTELAEQVGAGLALGSDTQPGAGTSSQSHAVGSAVTLTWLIHDVTVWRVDRVYVDAAGGPWIASQESTGGTASIWDVPETWHRSSEPKALVALLGSMGLLGGTSGALPGEGTAPVTAPSAQQDVTTASDGAGQGSEGRAASDAGSGATEDGFSPVLAGLLGLVAGALVAGLVTVALVRRSDDRRLWQGIEGSGPAEDDVVSSGGALTRR